MAPESYLGFSILPKGSLNQKSEFEFSFYTLEQSGILLLANPGTKYDYEAVFLNDGKIVYVFNAGTGSLTITTPKTYNDGKWHLVRIVRAKTDGFLYVEDQLITQSKAGGTASTVNNLSMVYFGGYPADALVSDKIPKSKQVGLKGGMRGFKSFSTAIIPFEEVGITKAYDGLSLKEGVSFGKNGGYAAKEKSFKVGLNFKIALDVRAANKSGYIFFVSGTSVASDFVSLQINADGDIEASCNNGGGKFTVTVKLPTTNICDGDFHSILLVKNGKDLTLTIDGTSATTTSKGSSSSAETTSPLYFGGIPEDFPQRPTDYTPFSGCLTTVYVADKAVDLTSSDVVFGGSTMRGCAE